MAVGDQVATRRNDPTRRTDRGEKVRNRHTWTVTTIDTDGSAVVSHPERGTATLPAAYVARHAELGWAVTGYGNQGDTVDTGLAVLEPGTTRNHAYVALTRGRRSNHALIPDPTGSLDPSDELTGMITREADSSSALATHTRLHHEAGADAPSVELDAPETGAAQLRGGPRNQSSRDPVPSEPGLDERIRSMQARLDRLEHRSPHEIDRSLGR